MRGHLIEHYLVALGSNRRHPQIGDPRHVLAAALEALALEWTIETTSPVIASVPIGPSQRRYANAAVVLTGPYAPPEALERLQQVERDFGRDRRGARWRARVLDLDIVLWSGGCWMDAELRIPHPLFRQRPFVIEPAATIAPTWRDPVTGLTLRQLAGRQLASR